MQTADRTTINQSLYGDDVVNFAPLRASSIEGEQRFLADPRRGAEFHVLSSEVKPCWIMRIARPPFTPRQVNGFLAFIVSGLFLTSDAFAVSSVRSVPVGAPGVLIGAVLPEVDGSANDVICTSADLALVADAVPFLVVRGTPLIDAAGRADFGLEGLRAGFHNIDIIATEGDVKPRELREKRVTPIRSQADQEWSEGSETRAWSPDRTVKPHERAARDERDEIVRAVRLNAQKQRIKSHCDNKLTTIQNRSGDLADNFTNNNALLRKLKAKGNVRPFGGGNVILQEIAYTDASTVNANSYSGYEVLNIAPNSPISAAQFSICQYAAAVTMSGLEMLQSSSKEAIIDLMEGRVSVAEGQLQNRLDYDLYQNGTGNAGKNVTGLAAAVPDTPTSGTYGGIDRASFAFWQSVSYSGVTNGGAAVSAVNIAQYMTALGIRLVRGKDMPDLWVADNTYYQYYVNSLQAIQRVNSESGSGTAGAGFPSLKFYGGGMAADVVLGGGVSGAVSSTQTTSGATSAHMWALNTNYLFFRPHRDRNFVPIGGERQSVNQDAIVKLIGWAGNLAASNSSLQGVLVA